MPPEGGPQPKGGLRGKPARFPPYVCHWARIGSLECLDRNITHQVMTNYNELLQ